ncbi:MAG TPA: CHAT domain-containing protein [Pyrinomonadaceae bacterium]|nr:CHAT domain-containing protein [Pyrinomonadaceae bacterium]
MERIPLDDLYRMVAAIYSEQNALRSTAATYAHFVEICGMLTIHDRNKKKEGVSVEDALCKALGWYFPLLAKMRVKSVEDLVFRKYPYVCPYCRKAPHDDYNCKLVRGTESTVNHEAVRDFYNRNREMRPKSLNGWQTMFQKIYPRSAEDRGRSTLGLFEELGEIGEAIRVFDRYPKYFAGEAADVFSYIMGIANEHSVRVAQDHDRSFSLEDEFLRRYPGLCKQCGFRVCICPSVPKATVGRMAKELDIDVSENLFQVGLEDFTTRGIQIGAEVIEKVGGYPKLGRFPFDRGDANRALMILCLKLASGLEVERPEIAERFRSVAIHLGSEVAEPGSPSPVNELPEITDLAPLLRDAWRELDPAEKAKLMDDGEPNLVAEIGAMLGKVRVLFVHASPSDQVPLRVASELRAVKEAIRLAHRETDILVESLPAATPDDLRRILLRTEFEIIHFSGHADEDVLVFEKADGTSISSPLTAVADVIAAYPSIKCVILNACNSAAAISVPMAPYTIGMDASIGDDAAIEFARGFYDALAANKGIGFAIEEGKRAAELNSQGTPPIKVLTK